MAWTVQFEPSAEDSTKGTAIATEDRSGYSQSQWVDTSDSSSVANFVKGCKVGLPAYAERQKARESAKQLLISQLNG